MENIHCACEHDVMGRFPPQIPHIKHTTQDKLNHLLYLRYIMMTISCEFMSSGRIMSADPTEALLWTKNFHQLLYAATCQLKLISWQRVFTEGMFPQLWISKQGSRDLLGHGCQCGKIDGVIST